MGKRNSTFEFLRIIAMLLIMMEHIVIYGLGGSNFNVAVPAEGSIPVINDIIISLCIVGVNLFILITGWFGVKSVSRSLYRLLPIFLVAVVTVMILKKDFNVMIFGFSDWWFVPHFCVLVIVSPIIEKSIEEISIQRFTTFIIILAIVNIIIGYFLGYINANGYNYVNFVFLYYIARFLRVIKNDKRATVLFKYGWLVWIGSAIVSGILHSLLINHGYSFSSIRYWAYNNPLVLLSSISLFCYFTTRHINSNLINILAGGTFAVYLISTKAFGNLSIGRMSLVFFENGSYLGVVLYSILITLALYIPCAIICWLCRKIPAPSFVK